MLDVAVEGLTSGDLAPAYGWRRETIVGDHLANVRDAGVSAEWPRLFPHHLHAVVLLRIVRRRNFHAAVMSVARDGEVEHVGGVHPVVDDVGALRGRSIDECSGQGR